MGQKKRKLSKESAQGGLLAISADLDSPEPASIDPTLAFLFSSSLGPVTKPILSENKRFLRQYPKNRPGIQDISASKYSQALGERDLEPPDQGRQSQIDDLESGNGSTPSALLIQGGTSGKKRKRKRILDEDIEGSYMEKLAQEEYREDVQRGGEQSYGTTARHSEVELKDLADVDSASEDSISILRHETVESKAEDDNLEKASRTIFLGNVSTTAISSKTAKKILKKHLSSFLPLLNASKSSNISAHKLESIRFRSTAYSSTAIPKRAAFARQELMDATTTSTNAYVVYSTSMAARQACKTLNGTMVLDRHLRVDGVAHPAKTDPKRCVFVGNLDFVDNEASTQIEAVDKPRKLRVAGDVEEGLWRQFEKAGKVESVRVVRDPKTRVGKGFGYVQFEDGNAVEAALLFNDRKYPPLLPRKIRVSRAKNIPKGSTQSMRMPPTDTSMGNGRKDANSGSKSRSLRGRAGKLFGHAGAAKVSKSLPKGEGLQQRARPPEAFIFEGHRATSLDKRPGSKGRDGKLKKKSQGKPQNRSSKRASAWKESGGRPAAKA